MWVARDKDGILWWFSSEPDRCSECWGMSSPNDDMVCIDSSLFPDLKWEDEPVEVKLVPCSADVIEMPSEEEIREYTDNYTRYPVTSRKAIDWLKSKIVK